MWGTPERVGNTIGETHTDVGNTRACREHDWCGKIANTVSDVHIFSGPFSLREKARMRVCNFDQTLIAEDPHPPLTLAASPWRERRSFENKKRSEPRSS